MKLFILFATALVLVGCHYKYSAEFALGKKEVQVVADPEAKDLSIVEKDVPVQEPVPPTPLNETPSN